MSISRKYANAALALSVALPAMGFATSAAGQNVTGTDGQVGATTVETLPPATTPLLGGETSTVTTITKTSTASPAWTEEKTVGPDGVETIIRTRYIHRPTTPTHTVRPTVGVPHYPMTPTTVVFERNQWLAECDRRTSGRSEKEKGGIIGGLLGAAAGGVLGNVVAGSGERLAGTLIGAGTGGLAGLVLGNIVGGGKKGDRYDCEAALDGYISQYGQPGAIRTIPHPYPPAGWGHAYTGHYSYAAGCGCQMPQVVMVPIHSEVRQRVIVREKVIEKTIHPPKPMKPVPIKPQKPPKKPPKKPSSKMIKR